MNVRQRFHAYLNGQSVDRVPRIESKFAPDTIDLWREQGHVGDSPPEELFCLDRHESVPVQMRKFDPPDDPRTIWQRIPEWYDAEDSRRFPDDWDAWCLAVAQREHLISFEPWHEGMFQIFGVRNAASIVPVLLFLIDEPKRAQSVLDQYTDYLERMIDKVCGRIIVDYAILYEPVASNQGPVISPQMARRYLLPCYRRVCERLEKYGVKHRFVWSSGRIHKLIPLWLDGGLNGLFVDQACAAGIDYRQVRKEYGPQLALMGGLDNATLLKNEDGIRRELESKIPQILDSGRYIPGLDDTVRAYIPFERFCRYREILLQLTEG